uniref:Endoplasmic reticulum vesicle transporter C-terminal domain-containing protein n=1 Tax=Graphocephala atropunctata TaxID=36148 RepID=A0A1B6KXN3_9HEMI
MVRQRKKISLDTVRELDSFPKLPETFVETSRVGGTFSIITCGLISWLIYSEISYYLQSRFIFKFAPDTDYDAKVKINVDLTVAMPCLSIGADIMDSTGQSVSSFGNLEEEDTWFELSMDQRVYFDNMRYMNSYLREEFHAIQDLLWKSGETNLYGRLPKRKYNPMTPPDACRLYGTITLNKVAGNFHITAGQALALPQGHIHMSAFMSDRDYNFTHRIHRFSFGDPSPGIIHPLEGDEKISSDNMVLYQYFIEAVPTEVSTFMSRSYTYQYSVKDYVRAIDHHRGSHGIPGIFFKYDTSALKIMVSEEREPLDQFFVRLCATVGGIFVTAGFINSIVQYLVKLCNRVLHPHSTVFSTSKATFHNHSSATVAPLIPPVTHDNSAPSTVIPTES